MKIPYAVTITAATLALWAPSAKAQAPIEQATFGVTYLEVIRRQNRSRKPLQATGYREPQGAGKSALRSC